MQRRYGSLAQAAFLVFVHVGWAVSGFANDSTSNAKMTEIILSKKALTLLQAKKKALANNPELEAYSLEIKAREAQTLQAGLWPNPTINFQMEDLDRRDSDPMTPSQSTLMLNQKIELGGKLDSRRRTASLSRDLAGWDFQKSRADILNRVTKRFIEALGAQERLKLIGEMLETSNALYKAVVEQVRGGKVSPIDLTKARIVLAETKMEMEKAKSEFAGARIQLSVQWGNVKPDFENVSGELYETPSIPPLDVLIKFVHQNPDLARWTADLAHREALIEEEKANAKPSVTLSGGYRRIDETDDDTVVLGFTVPLNFFNQNQGSIKSARNRLAKGENESQVEKIRVESKLINTHQILNQTLRELKILNEEIVPGSKSAYNAVNEGYRFGKFSLLNVLDSQKTYFRTRKQRILVLVNFHQALADIERLMGLSLSLVQKRIKNP